MKHKRDGEKMQSKRQERESECMTEAEREMQGKKKQQMKREKEN